jgi:hypothetical protein
MLQWWYRGRHRRCAAMDTIGARAALDDEMAQRARGLVEEVRGD